VTPVRRPVVTPTDKRPKGGRGVATTPGF
jgi:hypothetical protein